VQRARPDAAKESTCRVGSKPVLERPPQSITPPLALEPADVAIVGLDFVPNSFVTGPVKRGAALAGREGDFGFSQGNGTPEEGHDVELINFSGPGEPLRLELQRFAFNTTFEQAFVSGIRGINRPVDLKFGPTTAPTSWTTGRCVTSASRTRMPGSRSKAMGHSFRFPGPASSGRSAGSSLTARSLTTRVRAVPAWGRGKGGWRCGRLDEINTA